MIFQVSNIFNFIMYADDTTTVFNLSLEEGVVPLKWKEANIIQLFKKVRETIQRTVDQ